MEIEIFKNLQLSLYLTTLDSFWKGKPSLFPHSHCFLLQIQVTLHLVMPRKDCACTKLQGGDYTDSACSKHNVFLLINTLLECVWVGAWIAIFQKTVASCFFFTVRAKTEKFKNLM